MTEESVLKIRDVYTYDVEGVPREIRSAEVLDAEYYGQNLAIDDIYSRLPKKRDFISLVMATPLAYQSVGGTVPADHDGKPIGLVFAEALDAMDYAREIAPSVMHFKTDGIISVWSIDKYPSLDDLRYLVNGSIESLNLNLGNPHDSGYIGYANADGLGKYPINFTLPLIDQSELFCGPAVLIVGAVINNEGDEVLAWHHDFKGPLSD